MTNQELTAFAEYIRTHVGVSETNEAPLHGLLDGYGLQGAEREEMIAELHKIGAIKSIHIDSNILLNKLPKS